MAFDVLSPDGFSISFDTFDTFEEAQKALFEFVERYKKQGYYSSNKGKISLEELPKNCQIIAVE